MLLPSSPLELPQNRFSHHLLPETSPTMCPLSRHRSVCRGGLCCSCSRGPRQTAAEDWSISGSLKDELPLALHFVGSVGESVEAKSMACGRTLGWFVFRSGDGDSDRLLVSGKRPASGHFRLHADPPPPSTRVFCLTEPSCGFPTAGSNKFTERRKNAAPGST